MAKIREHQLKRILEQMSSKDKLLIDIGDLEAKKHSLLHALHTISQEMEQYKSELENEYGAINIDLSDGSYTKLDDNGEQNS